MILQIAICVAERNDLRISGEHRSKPDSSAHDLQNVQERKLVPPGCIVDQLSLEMCCIIVAVFSPHRFEIDP